MTLVRLFGVGVVVSCLVAGAEGPVAARVKTFAVHAGKLVDVRTGKETKDAYVVITGERIVSVGTAVPAGMSVVDMSAYTVVPGLIDAHGHSLG